MMGYRLPWSRCHPLLTCCLTVTGNSAQQMFVPGQEIGLSYTAQQAGIYLLFDSFFGFSREGFSV